MCEAFYAHPEGEDSPYETFKPYDKIPSCNKFQFLGGKAGDVVITHIFLPHASSPNRQHNARIITNPHVCLKDKLELYRPDGDYVSGLAPPGKHTLSSTVAVPRRRGHPPPHGPRIHPRVQKHPT